MHGGKLRNVHFHDIPDVILSTIFSLVTDTRTRNAISLVCLKWLLFERSTRKSLTLRGDIRDLFLLPTCFRAVTNLDLSFLSPWGYPPLDFSPEPLLLAQLLRRAFPFVVSLIVYVRNPLALHLLAPQWPNLQHVKLIRWHQRFPMPLGYDFTALSGHCHTLSSLDVSDFYCWTEDLPPAIEAFSSIASSLSHLNILKHPSAEGFKSHELLAITASCPNLRELLATCVFDHRFIGFVGNQTLLALASNCPYLSLLHLVDATSLYNVRPIPNEEGNTSKDASISHSTLGDVFAGLPLLEELVLDVCHHVGDTWKALELLNSRCPRLKSLKLSQFQKIWRCIDSRPDEILCQGLQSLSLQNSADLTDKALVAISLGCPRLSKFEVQGCNRITGTGMWKLTHVLRKTLVDVKISYCKKLNAVSSLKAMEPIRDRIERLHIDCVWENNGDQYFEGSSNLQTGRFENLQARKQGMIIKEEKNLKKECKSYDIDIDIDDDNLFSSRTWNRLKFLSLWIAVGELLSPLTLAGLDDCPALEEIQIKIEGDCRDQPRPFMNTLGLSSLTCYPKLSKMHLDCSGVIGFALTAPIGQADLSLWERFFLNGIENLHLNELNYWPAQDIDVNQRSLFLPAAALIAQCWSLRKLLIHGTVNEHLMMFLLKIPNLRDAQFREDYYPAPENDSITEMRISSCFRFEDALNSSSRQIPD